MTSPAETPTASRGARTRFPREVWVLAGVAFFVALGFGVIVPVIPVFARTFGVSAAAAGAVVAAFALMRLVGAPLSGRLVNRIGERSVLGVGIGIVAVSSALAGLSQTYVQLLVLRGVGGIGSAMFTVSALALLIRSVPDALRGRASGMFGAGFLLGGVVGPAFGGAMAAISLRAPFFFYAAVLAVAGAFGFLMLPRHRDVPAHERHEDGVSGGDGAGASGGVGGAVRARTVREALRFPAYRAALVASFAAGFTLFGVRSATVPLYVTEELGQAASVVAWGLLVAAVANGVALWPVGRAADSRGRRPVLVAGAAVAGIGMALLAVAGGVPGFLLAMVVTGLGSGSLQVAPAAIVGDTVGRRGGTVVAAQQMSGDLGAVTGPLLAGILVDTSGYPAAFWLTAGVLGVAALVGVRAPETLAGAAASRSAKEVTPAPGEPKTEIG